MKGLGRFIYGECIRIYLKKEWKTIWGGEPQYTRPIFEPRSPRHRQSSIQLIPRNHRSGFETVIFKISIKPLNKHRFLILIRALRLYTNYTKDLTVYFQKKPINKPYNKCMRPIYSDYEEEKNNPNHRRKLNHRNSTPIWAIILFRCIVNTPPSDITESEEIWPVAPSYPSTPPSDITESEEIWPVAPSYPSTPPSDITESEEIWPVAPSYPSTPPSDITESEEIWPVAPSYPSTPPSDITESEEIWPVAPSYPSTPPSDITESEEIWPKIIKTFLRIEIVLLKLLQNCVAQNDMAALNTSCSLSTNTSSSDDYN
uniref:Uncharacterized protein n=1 Tax=Timema douglasi TaxID=61478 RepID=A0A7R8ZA25_TIMDO|nr:unnamed protein product [Timema douglasi]